MESDEITKEVAALLMNRLLFGDEAGIKGNKKDSSLDDKKFREDTSKEIGKRDIEYTRLLQHFVGLTKVRNTVKEIVKWAFCLVIIVCVIVLGCITNKLVNKYIAQATVEQMIDAIPLLLMAIGGFVSAVIVIPVTITKYLFSTQEDRNITKIISHTQNHDLSGRQWMTEFLKAKSQDEQSKTILKGGEQTEETSKPVEPGSQNSKAN